MSLLELRVYYEDTDCGGVVYYANYWRWLERARTEFFRARGVDLAALMREDLVFSVSECAAKYRRPAKYDDLVQITTTVEDVGGAAFWLSHQISRDGELLVEARVRMAAMSEATGRPKRLPEAVRAAL